MYYIVLDFAPCVLASPFSASAMKCLSVLRCVLRPPFRGGLLLLVSSTGPVQAQFSPTAAATQFVCNAPGNQVGVQAFADGAGGAYTVWIDRRNGNNTGPGTAIFAQHLDASGTALLPTNGLRLFQTGRRDVFAVRATPWQAGLLVACPPGPRRPVCCFMRPLAGWCEPLARPARSRFRCAGCRRGCTCCAAPWPDRK